MNWLKWSYFPETGCFHSISLLSRERTSDSKAYIGHRRSINGIPLSYQWTERRTPQLLSITVNAKPVKPIRVEPECHFPPYGAGNLKQASNKKRSWLKRFSSWLRLEKQTSFDFKAIKCVSRITVTDTDTPQFIYTKQFMQVATDIWWKTSAMLKISFQKRYSDWIWSCC